MDGHDELLTIAEIAVGLAGFSGVVAGFIRRGGLSAADRLRFIALFVSAFAVLVLAFIPIALAYSGFQDESIWRRSIIVMMLAQIAGFGSIPFAMHRIRKEIAPSLLASILVLVPPLINVVVQLMNAGAWIWQPNFVPYLIGMILCLFEAGLIFVFIVLFRPPA
ncbi:MAG: hypothetical protein JRG80_05130 [Deltaproteobacteria bacterium]|nr:hypothetical protein [Deltaproteobacteria bacterium]